MSHRILITGATGFIGRHLARQLDASGRHTVAALVRPGVARDESRHFPTLPKSLQIIEGSLAEPAWRSIESFAPNIVIHTAWITTPGVYLDSPENDAHRDWSLRFLSRLIDLGVGRFVVLGTCIEYAPSPEALVEDHSLVQPSTRYAQCKHSLHQALLPLFQRAGVSWVWGRLFHPYGEGEHPQRLCSATIESFRRGRAPSLKTPFSAKDYIHVADVARALETICEAEVSGAVNLGVGAAVSIATIVQTIARLLGCEPPVFPAAPPSSPPADRTVADIRKLLALGWSPQVPLETGLQRLIQHLT